MGCGRRKVSHDCPLSSVGQLQLAELSSPQESCEEREGLWSRSSVYTQCQDSSLNNYVHV